MTRFMIVLGWILIGMALVTIAYPFFGDPATFEPFKNALPAGVLIALAAQLFTQSKSIKEAQEKRSLFYLDSCVKAFEEARNLLSDGNNSRVTWIEAGRALVHALELAKEVTEDQHKRVLELHRLKYRGFFGALITDKPPAFFYGGDPTLSIEEAAKQSSIGAMRNGRPLITDVKLLSEKALRAVWEAAQWPEHYQDPLGDGFKTHEVEGLRLLYPGLHGFLEHKLQWHSVAGKLHPRNPTENR
jgi:hypothetical protein